MADRSRSLWYNIPTSVDLAVWDRDDRLYYRAAGRLLSLDPAISIDLVEAELAPPYLLTRIEREGVPV